MAHRLLLETAYIKFQNIEVIKADISQANALARNNITSCGRRESKKINIVKVGAKAINAQP